MIERIFYFINYFTRNEFVDDLLYCKKQINDNFQFLIIFNYCVFKQQQNRVDKTHHD